MSDETRRHSFLAGVATATIIASIISLFFPAVRIVGIVLLSAFFAAIAYRRDFQSEFWQWIAQVIRASRK
jgi:hypothetical protein